MKLDTVSLLEAELARQRAKWGDQHHYALKWLGILVEEVGELAAAIIEGDTPGIGVELLHTAAVAVQWMDSGDVTLPTVPNEDKWRCGHCSFLNMPWQKNCYGCGAPRTTAPPTPSWRCKTCSSQNDMASFVCFRCREGRRPDGWACPKCANLNPLWAQCCTTCSTSNPAMPSGVTE